MNKHKLLKSLAATLFLAVFFLYGGQLSAQCSVSTGPTNNCTYGDAIDILTINAISATNTGCSGTSTGYTFFSSPIWNLNIGASYPISLSVGGSTYNQGVTVWIDLNSNLQFESTEVVYTSSGSALTHTGTLSIPGTATADTVRMRVMCAYTTVPANTDACTNNLGGYGETEDYRVVLSPLVVPGADANAGSVLAPLDNACGKTADSVWVLISNEGTDTINGLPIVTNLSGLGTGSFNDTIPQLLPGDSANVYVTSVNTQTGGTLGIQVITQDTGDVNSANDTLNESLTIFNSESLTISGPTSACDGDIATLNVNTNGSETYTWYQNSVGGTMILTADSLIVSLSMDTTFAVSSSNTCRASDSLSIMVGDTTALIATAPDSVCEGESFWLILNPLSGETYSWYQDSIGGTLLGTGDSLMLTATPGVTMFVAGASNECRGTAQKSIVISPLPTASFAASTTGDTVAFTGTTTNSNSVFWDFGDGNTSTAANPTHIYGASGTYTVCYTSINDCDSVTSCDTVTVSLVGVIPGYANSQITLFPNPTEDMINIKMVNLRGLTGEWMITDLQGRVIQSQKISLSSNLDNTSISLKDLPGGSYLFRLQTSGSNFSRVIMKQ